jgi:hypothetical protein
LQLGCREYDGGAPPAAARPYVGDYHVVHPAFRT